jgi:hypothetical protein
MSNEETKGKLVDGAIVAAKATTLAVVSFFGMSQGVVHTGTIPRPIRMWRNQRAKRRSQDEQLAAELRERDNLRACIARGSFRYRGFQIQCAPHDAPGPLDHTQWAFHPTDVADWEWQGHYSTAEECMRQIDEASAAVALNEQRPG